MMHHACPRGPGEPGRFSQAHEGVVYGCCVPALTRFTNPHCPGPPRFTRTSAEHSGMSILISYSQARRAQLQGEGLTGTTVQKDRAGEFLARIALGNDGPVLSRPQPGTGGLSTLDCSGLKL